MNKAQLIAAVACRGGYSKADAAVAVDVVLDAIVREVVAGGTVSVTGFGKIGSRVRSERIARNPSNGDRMQVPATRRVFFQPGQRFIDLVAGRKSLSDSGNSIKKAPKTPRR